MSLVTCHWSLAAGCRSEKPCLPPPTAQIGSSQAHCSFDDARLKGMMSIGLRPTIDGKHRTIEVNLFDFDEDIYGKELRVFVIRYLRPELKFSGLDQLKTAIAKDKVDALAALIPAPGPTSARPTTP